MNEVKEKHQQQILFDDEQLIESSNNDLKNKQQVIFDNHDWLPVANEAEEIDVLPEKKSSPRWLWRVIFSLISIIITVELVEFFINGFNDSPIITSIYAGILACVSLVAGTALGRELSGLRQLKAQQKLKEKAVNAMQNGEVIDVKSYCQNITDKLPCDLLSEQELQWSEAINSGYSAEELLNLYSRIVLAKVDQKAMAEIAKFSTESVVLVALSPIALLDMMIVLWRNLRMIDKITGLYGLKLGYWARLKLIKQVFINIAYAGASELVTSFGTEMLGADLLGKLSGRLAQGLGAGMLTARLGLKTIQLCRPLPFDENAPQLGHVRKEVLNQIKQLMKSN